MIPWRDYSFITDEDDILLVETLKEMSEKPVTGKQFYEPFLSNYDPNTEPSVLYFDNLVNDDTLLDKNHVLLFLIIIGALQTTLGIMLVKNWFSLRMLCTLLMSFGILDVVLQTFEMMKNEDTANEEDDFADSVQRTMFLMSGLIMIVLSLLLYIMCSK